jgi:hypothetical protein
MSKKFGDYQIQTGELYSTTDGYRVSINVRGEILSINIRWKLSFMPSSSVHLDRFDDPE